MKDQYDPEQYSGGVGPTEIQPDQRFTDKYEGEVFRFEWKKRQIVDGPVYRQFSDEKMIGVLKFHDDINGTGQRIWTVQLGDLERYHAHKIDWRTVELLTPNQQFVWLRQNGIRR